MNHANARWRPWVAAGLVAALALVWLILLADPAWAQTAAPTQKRESLFKVWVLAGGKSIAGFAIVAVLIGLSITGIALIIEHSVTLRRDKIVPPDVIVEMEQLIEEEQYEEAVNLCETTRNYITNVVGAALAKMGEGFESMAAALEAELELENLKLLQKISWLNLLASVGPLLGLFGTVFGMVGVFMEMSSRPQVTPPDMAGGIYTALVTTVWGLIVAIPSLSGYFWFRNRVQRMTFELSSIAAELLDQVKAKMATGK